VRIDAQTPSLARISAELQAICECLAGSPTMTVEFGEELVKLDTLAQTLQQLARRANA
jgi:allophanate hydrolase subunit 1